MIDGIIFDLDGTMWDSCDTVAASWQHTLREFYDPTAIITRESISSIMGMTTEQIIGIIFSPYGERAAEICHHVMEVEAEYCASHGGKLFPGLEEALKSLSAHHPLFIVSNCQVGYIQAFLRFTGFSEYFTDYIEQGATGLSKGENISLIISRHGLSSPVYVGDTQSDKNAADAASCPFIHASYGFGKVPDAVNSISAISELPALIASL